VMQQGTGSLYLQRKQSEKDGGKEVVRGIVRSAGWIQTYGWA